MFKSFIIFNFLFFQLNINTYSYINIAVKSGCCTVVFHFAIRSLFRRLLLLHHHQTAFHRFLTSGQLLMKNSQGNVLFYFLVNFSYSIYFLSRKTMGTLKLLGAIAKSVQAFSSKNQHLQYKQTAWMCDASINLNRFRIELMNFALYYSKSILLSHLGDLLKR